MTNSELAVKVFLLGGISFRRELVEIAINETAEVVFAALAAAKDKRAADFLRDFPVPPPPDELFSK